MEGHPKFEHQFLKMTNEGIKMTSNKLLFGYQVEGAYELT